MTTRARIAAVHFVVVTVTWPLVGTACKRAQKADPSRADPSDASTARTSTAGRRIATATIGDHVHLPEAAIAGSDLGPRVLSTTIRANLEAEFVQALGDKDGPALSQVVARVLVWWMNPSQDLRPGDAIDVVFESNGTLEPTAHALWFTSQKLGRTMSAVLFRSDGDGYARWYSADGEEVEMRLVDGPIEDYEQITSLVGDGRRHQGVDFKTAVGTPVVAPFDGVVVRKNWGMRANGMSLDLKSANGPENAVFLHLSAIEPSIRIGSRISKGAPIARSGNTGRSTAPHLHYQLMRGKKVLDPFRIHQTRRRRLAAANAEAMQAALSRFDVLRKRGNDAARTH